MKWFSGFRFKSKKSNKKERTFKVKNMQMQTQTQVRARIRFLEAEDAAAAAECVYFEALNVLEELRFGDATDGGGTPASAIALASAVAAEEELARKEAVKAWDAAKKLERDAIEEAFTEFAFSTYARYDRRGWSPQAAMDCVARAGESGFGGGLAEIRASRARLEEGTVGVHEKVIDGVTYLYDEAGGFAGLPHLLLTPGEQPVGTYDVQSGEIIFLNFEEVEEEEVRQQPQR